MSEQREKIVKSAPVMFGWSDNLHTHTGYKLVTFAKFE